MHIFVMAEATRASIDLGAKDLSNRTMETDDSSLVKTSERTRKAFAVISGFICICLSDGLVNFLSVLFVKLHEEFGKSNAETAVMQSVASGTFYIGGILGGLITSRFGLIKVGLLGATIEVVGLAASFFATNIETLIVTLGFVYGFGCSVVFVFGNTISAIPFQGTARFTAICTASFGTGLGSVIYPFVIEYMSLEYGWRGTLLILSGVTSHLFAVILLNTPRNAENLTTKHSSTLGDNTKGGQNFSTLNILIQILRDKMFVAFSIATSLAFGVLLAVLIFQVDYFEEIGYDRQTSVMFYTAVTVASTVARPLPGLLERIPHFGTFAIEGCAILFGAIAYSFLPLVNSNAMIIVFNSMIGVFVGMVGALTNAGAMKLLDKKRYPVGLGLLMTIIGITVVVAGPLAGLIKDSTGSYRWLYHGTGVFFTLCAIFLLSIAFLRKVRKKTLQ